MQTFLPYSSFTKTAAVLDRQRLGKQRVETLQILRSLSGITKGWTSHPAVKMWGEHEWILAEYGLVICSEWTKRGYKDTCADKIITMADEYGHAWGKGRPQWLGWEALHLSHRSNLVRKDPTHYGPLFPDVTDDHPYVWPE